jgi:hypothetical protein
MPLETGANMKKDMKMNNYKKFLIFSIFSSLPLIASAQIWVIANTTSHHFSNEKFNQKNYGIGLEIDKNENLSYAAGVYINSLYKDSGYIAASYTPHKIFGTNLGVFGGATTNYKDCNICPAGGLIAKFDFEDFGVNILYIPKTIYNPNVITFQLKCRFN